MTQKEKIEIYYKAKEAYYNGHEIMTDFEWVLSICLFIWILILSDKVISSVGYGIIVIIMIIYYLVTHDFFGGGR